MISWVNNHNTADHQYQKPIILDLVESTKRKAMRLQFKDLPLWETKIVLHPKESKRKVLVVLIKNQKIL